MEQAVIHAQRIGQRVLARLECGNEIIAVPASVVRWVKLDL